MSCATFSALAPATINMCPPTARDSSFSGGLRPCWPSCRPHDPGLASFQVRRHWLARALTEPAVEDHVFTTPPARQNASGGTGGLGQCTQTVVVGSWSSSFYSAIFSFIRHLSLGVCDRGDKGDWKGEWWNRAGPRGRQGARARIKGRSLSPLSHPPASPQMRGSPRSHACHTDSG